MADTDKVAGRRSQRDVCRETFSTAESRTAAALVEAQARLDRAASERLKIVRLAEDRYIQELRAIKSSLRETAADIFLRDAA